MNTAKQVFFKKIQTQATFLKHSTSIFIEYNM